MKKKLILAGSIALLVVIMAFMAWDIFFNQPGEDVNPYALDLKDFRVGDTVNDLYAESGYIKVDFGRLYGIATDRHDAIYVCGERFLTKFDTLGHTLLRFPVEGTARSVHVSGDGKILLGVDDHVEIFDPAGKQLAKWTPLHNGSVITSIAVSGDDVFVADAFNKVVYRTDLLGNLLGRIGEKDPARNIPGFVIPSAYFDLGIGYRDELWVVNPGRHKFEQYTVSGDLVSTWGESSISTEGFSGCCNPSNFAILSDGSFVTSEKGIERVKVYWPDGTFRGMVAGPGSFIEGTKGLDLAVDTRDRILVLDPEKKQVRIFDLKTTGNEK